MRSLLTLTTVILAVGLVVTSADEAKPQEGAVLAKRYGQSCFVNNRIYQHGQVFTIDGMRCIKYRCNNGNYNFYQEGCDAFGICRRVNQQFDHECRSYVCQATEVLGSYKKYQIRPLSRQQCKDIYGNCYPPGHYFEYVMHGRRRKRCTCRPTGLSITYYCYD